MPIIKKDFKVIAYPDLPRESVCNEIQEQILRHVDSLRRVEIQFETDYECDNCNLIYHPDDIIESNDGSVFCHDCFNELKHKCHIPVDSAGGDHDY